MQCFYTLLKELTHKFRRVTSFIRSSKADRLNAIAGDGIADVDDADTLFG